MALSMDDAENSSRQQPPLSSAVDSAKQSSKLWQKLWSWTIGRLHPAVRGIAAFLGALAVIASYFSPIENFTRDVWNFTQDRFDALIAGAVKREMAKNNLELKEYSVKYKLGPVVAGRFSLDIAHPEWKVDVFWREGYSTWLWVKPGIMENECIRIVSRNSTISVLEPGPSKAIHIAKMLTVNPGALAASGVDASEIIAEQHKGIFDDIHQLTFLLGKKDNVDLRKCRRLEKSDAALRPVEVEYFMATSPLVTAPLADEVETK